VTVELKTEEDTLMQRLFTAVTLGVRLKIDISVEVPHLSTIEFVNQKKLVGLEGLIW